MGRGCPQPRYVLTLSGDLAQAVSGWSSSPGTHGPLTVGFRIQGLGFSTDRGAPFCGFGV